MGGQAELSSLPIRDLLLVGRSSNSRQLDMAEDKKERKPRNYVLGGSGVMRYSHSKMYHKKGIFAIKNKEQNKKAKKPMTPAMVTKDIKGENNGEKRLCAFQKCPSLIPPRRKTDDSPPARRTCANISTNCARVLLLALCSFCWPENTRASVLYF